ncbi:lyase family protein [Roseomonas sp. BN140053]|uniref:lyase family protein n=1 Tax=Roseomonas sp. BN140053 TaxID=3391898 RepID=UPI0039EBCE8C
MKRIAAALMLVLAATSGSAGAADPPRDGFFWLGEMNKASAVMVVEQGIVPRPLGTQIANSIRQVIEEGARPGAARSADYLVVERSLVAAGGPDVTRLHSGRSRQDLGATFGRLFLREDVLDLLDSLNAAREVVLRMAAAHPDDIVPAYTWGVQAQPITFGHYMLGYAEALNRAAARLRESYARINQSPLGSAALGTSSFPVNRPRLAALLGFDGVIENSFDANQIAEADTRAEADAAAATGALTVGMLLADITQQYAQTRPWLLLSEGGETGTSSIMPQKRNPSGMVYLRALASTVVAGAQGYMLRAHNVPAGMMDYKLFAPDPVLRDAARMYQGLASLLPAFRFDPPRALEEVNNDYSTTTELADTLQRVADVPFRIGHHFASELVTFGRSRGLRPTELPFDAAQRIYTEAAQQFGQANAQLPLTEEQFRRSLSATGMVQASQGLGGPQPAEVARMQAVQMAALDADRGWAQAARTRLDEASRQRDAAFARLSASTP